MRATGHWEVTIARPKKQHSGQQRLEKKTATIEHHHHHHHQLSSSCSEGWHATLQALHWHLSSASILTSSQVSCFVHCFISSSRIRRGLLCVVVASSLPSNTWSASSRLDPLKTRPVKVSFRFWVFPYRHISSSFIRLNISLFQILPIHFISSNLLQHHCSNASILRIKSLFTIKPSNTCKKRPREWYGQHVLDTAGGIRSGEIDWLSKV